MTVPGHGVVEGVLERRELLVLVVAIDGDLLDQAVEFGIGLAGWAHVDGSPFSVAQAAGFSLSRTSGGQRISPLLKRPIGRCKQTVALWSSSSTTLPWMPCR
jgi:hypothetical protein